MRQILCAFLKEGLLPPAVGGLGIYTYMVEYS
jgi:hypothetical protein